MQPNNQPILVAEYQNVRYECPITKDKLTYTYSNYTGADITIPGKSGSAWKSKDTGYLSKQRYIDAVIAVFYDTGELQYLTVVDDDGNNVNILDRTFVRKDGIRFWVEYRCEETILMSHRP